MRVLCHRVDALTFAARVKLDPLFVGVLQHRAKVASKHNRAQLRYTATVPDDGGDGTIKQLKRLGPIRLLWADEAAAVTQEEVVWGELRYSRQSKTWLIVNTHWRARVQFHAPGGGEPRSCTSCGCRRVDAQTVHCDACEREPCSECNGTGLEQEPGWTVEIIWSAQSLADWGVVRALAESAALAKNMGRVFETCIRRLDLCADVAGWLIDPEDVSKRLAKRPHAIWDWHQLQSGDAANDDDDDDDDDDEDAEPSRRVPKGAEEREETHSRVYGKGVAASMRVTGIDVGKGGRLMMRCYDKRAELERDEDRRDREEDRWKVGGWNGIDDVARIEFQIRGEVLKELGVKDPDAAVEPIWTEKEYVDRRGKLRTRRVLLGYRPYLVKDDSGAEVQATIAHRLDDIWRVCLDWARLVEPEMTREGNPKPVTRCKDDPRWALLRTIRFTDAEPRPLRRYRVRGVANSAMALGVSLSQSAREGRLAEMSESALDYEETSESVSKLRSHLTQLKTWEIERIIEWLIERFGGVAGAWEHLAVLNNAARARHHRGFDPLDAEWRPPDDVGGSRAA